MSVLTDSPPHLLDYDDLDSQRNKRRKTQKLEDPEPEVVLCNHPGSFGKMCITCGERNWVTKLRPFVHKFLKEASKMFEMYIYTMGTRGYALQMAKLLDPQGEYFNGRVISRDEGTQKDQKGLDVILGQETAVLKSDETEHDGALACVLKALQRIHHMFFHETDDGNLDIASRDVRQVMKTVRKEVLKGCKIASQVIILTKSQAKTDVFHRKLILQLHMYLQLMLKQKCLVGQLRNISSWSILCG
ncbi:NLI interacting factor [Corchorus olitorius]|uniref:protein-serine/threonine phosphatase n=1 Tax=Corchorus olitorius TaxID=93759 RepID=A0A1R3ID47_9ROSI|nr:NLI interacting factor [Corchorus olitorius]